MVAVRPPLEFRELGILCLVSENQVNTEKIFKPVSCNVTVLNITQVM